MLTIKNLPFYWRFPQTLVPHSVIPQVYDFTFEVNSQLGMIIEKQDDELRRILDAVYLENANIGYMIDGHNLSMTYGADYLSFIRRVLNGVGGKRIVDIGCGGCTVLEQLRNENATVLGVDPSPVAMEASIQKSIPIINKFFGPGVLEKDYADALIQMDVFEHVYNPLELLIAEKDSLSDNGYIIINVPNCEYSVKNGDISMAIHQHVNMFTRYSLSKLVEDAGLYVASMELSGYGSALYCAATKNKTLSTVSSSDFKNQIKWVNLFCENANERIRKFRNFIDVIDNDSNVGLFVFQRALPYLAAAEQNLNKFRFFDNNVLWRGRYLDGIPVAIENIDDLLMRPTSKTLIMSNTFGMEIKSKILESVPNAKIFLQEDIFA